jgi:hypothetical protein
MSRPSRPRWLKCWSTMMSWSRPKPATSSTIPLRAAASLELWGSGLSPDIRWAPTIEAPALVPATTTPSALRPRMHSIASVPAIRATSRAWSPPVMKMPVASPQQPQRLLAVGVGAPPDPQPSPPRRRPAPEDPDVALAGLVRRLGGGRHDRDPGRAAAGQLDEPPQDLAAGALVLGAADRASPVPWQTRRVGATPRRRQLLLVLTHPCHPFVVVSRPATAWAGRFLPPRKSTETYRPLGPVQSGDPALRA